MKIIYGLLSIALLISCGKKEKNTKPIKTVEKKAEILSKKEATKVATFKGVQVTGVTVSNTGRIFANFPRWRDNVPYSVVEINPQDGTHIPYPNEKMNEWKIGNPIIDSMFVAVQSVVAFEDILYILDTRNPLFKGVEGAPKIFAYDLRNNTLTKIYTLDKLSYKTNSYINDLRVDKQKNKIYCTDSGAGGLVILDLETGKSKRILDNHISTVAETDHLMINGEKWENTVHSDGIALDEGMNKLYYHSLTGYSLYTVDTNTFDQTTEAIEQSIVKVAKTAAPDGMILDQQRNLYYADLEKHKIQYLTKEGEIKTLIEGANVQWADTFSIYDGFLYYTNSRIHEAKEDVSQMTFSIYKYPLE